MLPLFWEGLGEQKEYEEHEDGVDVDGEVEDGDYVACGFGENCGDERPQAHTGKETAVKIAKRYGTLGRCRAVCGVSVDDGHFSGKRSTNTV